MPLTVITKPERLQEDYRIQRLVLIVILLANGVLVISQTISNSDPPIGLFPMAFGISNFIGTYSMLVSVPK